MKLIIAGSRTVDKYRAFYESISNFSIGIDDEGIWDCREFDITEFVTGDCPEGADQVPYMLKELTYIEDYEMSIRSFPADWKTHGKAAGPLRNRKMAEYGDVLLLIWDGKSKGSANMKKEMLKLKKPVHEIIISVDTEDI